MKPIAFEGKDEGEMKTLSLPDRLHHTAYVSRDLEETRKFYEDVIGLPLIATWCEKDILFGEERTYCHCFFGLADGGALAFFQFARESDQALFGPPIPDSPFHHIALKVSAQTQGDIEHRLAKAGYVAPETYVLDHGYCRSVYVKDPNGMVLEFTLDAPEAEVWNQRRRGDAHSELARWIGGNHEPNNSFREADAL